MDSRLIDAIYHSPLVEVRTLLENGIDPNAPVEDGFPSLIAALSTGREAPGVKTRTDVDDLLQLLLRHGADPNQRGINDYTPLHMAVGERNAFAVQILLDAGADPDLRTRIDDYDTPLEMARATGFHDAVPILERRGAPERRRLRSGLMLLLDIAGRGESVRRQQNYRMRLRLWLSNGDPVKWEIAAGPVDPAQVEHDGATLTAEWRINRGRLINGLFYGIDGMRVGGIRRLEIAPHLAYGARGVPGIVPPNAVLVAEIKVMGVVSGQ